MDLNLGSTPVQVYEILDVIILRGMAKHNLKKTNVVATIKCFQYSCTC